MWKAAGASLVDSDWPTGERHSSAMVKKNRMSVKKVRSANFTGVGGWPTPSLVHRTSWSTDMG